MALHSKSTRGHGWAQEENENPYVLSSSPRHRGIHFAFGERQGSKVSGSLGGTGGVSPLHHHSPGLSPSYYRTLSVTGYGTGGAGDGYQYGECRPAVPLPLLSGEGPSAIPDFLKLVDEANEFSGGLSSLRSAPVLSWDDVSAQLQRPKGVPLIEDEDGGDKLLANSSRKDEADDEEEKNEALETLDEMEEDQEDNGEDKIKLTAKARELMALWALMPSWAKKVDDDEESESAHEEEPTACSEGGGEVVDDDLPACYSGLSIHDKDVDRRRGERQTLLPEETVHHMDSRFHPLSQVSWENEIHWGKDASQVEEDEEEEQADDSQPVEDGNEMDEALVTEEQKLEVDEPKKDLSEQGKEEEEGEIEDPALVRERLQKEVLIRKKLRRYYTNRIAAKFTPEKVEEESERVLRGAFPLNAELNDLRWTENIIWGDGRRRDNRPSLLSRLILDLNDPGIFFNVPELVKPDLEKMGLVAGAAVGLGGASAAGAIGGGAGRRMMLNIPTIEHAECAIRHETSIAHSSRICLAPEDARYFHRPRLPRHIQYLNWALRVPKEKGVGLLGHAGGGVGGSSHRLGGIAPKPIRHSKDLGAFDGEIVLIEYAEERPSLISNPGMASKLINLWRLSPENLKAEEELVMNKMKGNSGKSSSFRISREALGAKSIAMDLDHTHVGVPDFPQGQTIVLYPDDPSPFLGQIEDQMRQIALFTNMFKAPLFEHTSKQTDLLLVRAPPNRVRDPPQGQMMGETEVYAIREIPRIYLCGQIEPLMEVFHPDDVRFREFREKLFRFALATKLTGPPEDGGALMHHQHERTCSILDLIGPFNTLKEIFPEMDLNPLVGAQLNQIAHEVKGKEHQEYHWKINADVSIDEIAKEIPPEQVCIYESMCAGVRRLLDEGIDLVGKVASFAPSRIEPILARNLQCLLRDRQARAERARRSAELLKGTLRAAEAEEVANRLKSLYEEVRQLISVGAFILDEVQLTSWYLTHHYQAINNEKDYGGMLKLSGLGDPSGIGEGFSFLPRHQRESGRTFKEVLPTLDPILQSIIGDTPPFKMSVVMMNNILRHVWSVPSQRRMAQYRLSTAGYETELEELIGLTRAPKKLRIQIILDVDAGEVKTGAGVQEYINTCNRIWNKQVNALSDPSGQFGDEEALMDIDLDEGLGGGSANSKRTGITGGAGPGGGGGEDLEDAEAVQRELRERVAALTAEREEMERKRQEESILAGRPMPFWPRPKKVVKQLIKEVDVDGTERYRVEFLFAPQEVERVLRQRQEKLERLRKEARLALRRGSAGVSGEDNKLVLTLAGRKTRKRNPLTINLASLKSKASEHKERQWKKKKAKSEAEKQLYERKYISRKGPGEADEQGDVGQGGSPGDVRIPQRKPHLFLNLELDKIYSKIESVHYAKPFKRLKGKTIDLERIKKKLTDYRYASRQEFLDDFALIAQEAQTGDATLSEYAKAVQAAVIHGVTSLDENEMTELEMAVAVKNAGSLKRKRRQMRGMGRRRGRGAGRPPKSSANAGRGAAAAAAIQKEGGRDGGGPSLLPMAHSILVPPLLAASPPGTGVMDNALIFASERAPLIASPGSVPFISQQQGNKGEDSSSGEEEVLQEYSIE